jgi:hypothetical protein
MPGSVNGMNHSLVAGGLVEFEKCPVKVQGFRKITNHFQRNLSDVAKITIFVNLGLFRHFETVTNIRAWIKSHRYWRML